MIKCQTFCVIGLQKSTYSLVTSCMLYVDKKIMVIYSRTIPYGLNVLHWCVNLCDGWLQTCYPFIAVLWIRIHFFRIRIQSLMLETNTDPDPNPDPDPDPIRIQGFNDQKLKKNYS
jgi:hypothetical protein